MEVTLSARKEFFNKAGEPKGYGFNCLLHFHTTLLQINGLRVFSKGLMPPGITFGKGRYYSALKINEEMALAIYDEIIRVYPDLKEYIKNPREKAIENLVVNNVSLHDFGIPAEF